MTPTTEENEFLMGNLSIVPTVAHPIAKEASEVAANIKYHVQYSPHFMPLKFDPKQLFYATVESVQYILIQLWNETYAHFHREDPKQTYYFLLMLSNLY